MGLDFGLPVSAISGVEIDSVLYHFHEVFISNRHKAQISHFFVLSPVFSTRIVILCVFRLADLRQEGC